MSEITAEQILALVGKKSRELSDRETSNSRELYKDKNIKRYKDISRPKGGEILTMATPPTGEIKGIEVAKEQGLVSAEPAQTSSRALTGISVQHAKTDRGIKVAVTLQTSEDAALGQYVELTAELKRHSRLRELKIYEPDSYEFQQLYIDSIKQLKELSPEDGKSVCMGRLHKRGQRSEWVQDMVMIGRMDSAGLLEYIMFYVGTATYEINLDQMLSPAQERIYHKAGLYGNLQKRRTAPSLATLARKTFKEN
jgi:hypothetical protein